MGVAGATLCRTVDALKCCRALTLTNINSSGGLKDSGAMHVFGAHQCGRTGDYTLSPADIRFVADPHAVWKSPTTGMAYPTRWTLDVIPLKLQLNLHAALPHQEVVSLGFILRVPRLTPRRLSPRCRASVSPSVILSQISKR